jgi:hypothetical protein
VTKKQASHSIQLKEALTSPTLRAILRAGLVVLIRYLGTLAHPSAKIAQRIAIGVSIADKAIEMQGWVVEELSKLEKDLRKSSKQNPELVSVYKTVHKLRTVVKG